MRRLVIVFAAALGLYLPTIGFGFVQDDRAIVAANPAAHSVPAALRAFDDPYWPGGEASAGLYRPATILSYAVDWTISGGRPGWIHVTNALLHGVVCVLVVLVLSRWLPDLGAVAAGLVFALHPVHVEGVASLVSRAELLAAAGVLGAVLLARRRAWVGAVCCAALAMFSKEHGVVSGALILLDDWLQSDARRVAYPLGLYGALLAVTAGFGVAWLAIGRTALEAVAPPFIGADTGQRLALAFPALWRAATLLVWPASLAADYNPQVLPFRQGLSLAAALGALAVGCVAATVWLERRRRRELAFAAGAAALALLPTSNLLFPSGVVLAERALYLPVLLPAAGVGALAVWLSGRATRRAVMSVVGLLCVVLAWRSFERLPVWRDNRTFLTTLLVEHPESYFAHASAAAVLSGMGDTAAARREYQRADSLFPGDPHTVAGGAFFLLGLGDTLQAVPLVERARRMDPEQRMALRSAFLVALRRRDAPAATALADTAVGLYPWEAGWYHATAQSLMDSLRTAR